VPDIRLPVDHTTVDHRRLVGPGFDTEHDSAQHPGVNGACEVTSGWRCATLHAPGEAIMREWHR
jgi:hypothetical protein